jgi:lysyl-tRNA synthetase class II
MEVGIPVATTGGLGFDRLAMVLLDAVDIRDVMLFLTGAQY